MSRNCSIRQLRAFVAVAKLRNFTAAAQRLSVTQSTLTSSMQQLEAELGVRLFDRTTRKVSLTSAGAAFLPVAEKLVLDFDTAISDAKLLGTGERGKVSIATAASVMMHILAPCVAQFTESYPDIHLTIRDGVSADVHQRVAVGEADLGLSTPPDTGTALQFTPVLADQLGVVCRPEHPLLQGRGALPWSALQRYKYVRLTLDTGTRALLDSVGSMAPAAHQVTHEVSTVNMLYWLLIGNDGFSIVPALVADLPALRGLQFRLLGSPAIERQVGLLRSPDRSPSPAVQRFVQAIEHRLQATVSQSGVRLLRTEGLLQDR